jgi:hypothetical protein
MRQLHKRFSKEQIKELLKRYEEGKVERRAIEEVTGISRSRFFELLKEYRGSNGDISLGVERSNEHRRISDNIEEIIRRELDIDKALIEDVDVPIYRYNYSYIREQIRQKYGIEVSVPTIINRAKEWGYYKARKKNRDKHDREVISNYTGELIQHDSSHHLFAPMGSIKWYLITSIDDFSRYMLEARFVERESTTEHIKSLERVFTRYGLPMSYYTDSHRIFRYVEGRDRLHQETNIGTDGVNTQWQDVLYDLGVKPLHALSPQAKGKIERPYQWIQDHVVRRCVREGIVDMKEGQEILDEEVKEYNYKRVHSSTQEVPYYRYKEALEKNNLWRSFEIPKPYLSIKDIFCTRTRRVSDGYRMISLNGLKLRVNGLDPYEEVEIRRYEINKEMSDLRFWRGNRLLDIKRLKNRELRLNV